MNTYKADCGRRLSLRALLREPDVAAKLMDLHSTGKLNELLPELTALDIKSRAHKDMFLHSIKVLENAIELTNGEADDVLRIASLLHDMGKPATRKLSKNGASFVNHDLVGARMTKSALARHGYSKSEIAKVSTLIRLHMRGHTFVNGWTDSAVRRLITDAGDREQLERLTVLFAADATTSNIKKRNEYRRQASALRTEALRVMAEDERRALRPAINGDEVMALTGLKPGRELGAIMKFLNSDEGINLTREEAEAAALARANG